ncbi:MAG: hypothetical protein HF978_08860 [Desulfobacteraceae bacterium]|nr:hypothetical protein [Desulfobacteraceae bacterium]MBC2755643.1 hypothetical protein [Desulfobacteraceae bacterium]
MIKNTDQVIEAVFEDLGLKKKILKDVEDATDEQTIFASNTSALSIHAIAEGCRRPENVIGMHYFFPVHRIPLLEIITTDQTAEWVTATALDFGIKQGKTCIVVKDGPGFYTTRILASLLNEAVLCLEEGIIDSPQDGDVGAILGLGFPPFRGGPFRYIDTKGAASIVDKMDKLNKNLNPRFMPAQLLRDMASKNSRFYK